MDYRVLPTVLRALPDRKVLITRKMSGEVPDSDVVHIWVTRVRHPQAVEPTNLYVIEQRVWIHFPKGPGT